MECRLPHLFRLALVVALVCLSLLTVWFNTASFANNGDHGLEDAVKVISSRLLGKEARFTMERRLQDAKTRA